MASFTAFNWTDSRFSFIAAALLLLVSSITDLKEQRISLWATIGAALFGLLRSIASDLPAEQLLPDLIPALIPGLLMTALSFLPGEGPGGGDGLTLLALGLLLPFSEMIFLCAAAFFLAAICAGILFLKKRKGSARFPFIPFLASAFVLQFLLSRA